MTRRVEDPHWFVQFVIGLMAGLAILIALSVIAGLVEMLVQLDLTVIVAIPLVLVGIVLLGFALRVLGLVIIRKLDEHKDA